MGLFNTQAKRQKALTKVLGSAELPALPRSVIELLDVLRDDESSLEAITESLQQDPEVVSRVLRIVNSAAFGLRQGVNSVPHAIHLMGRANLNSLVLGFSVSRVLPKGGAMGFDHKKYITVAVRRAALAKEFASRIHPATQAEDFTAALLQDMAIPLLAYAKPEAYASILSDWGASEDAHLEEIETAALGWDHGEIGAAVAESWNLPASLTESIGSHHAAESVATPAVRIASLMRTKTGHTENEELIECARGFGVDPDWSVETIERSGDQTSELANLMG